MKTIFKRGALAGGFTVAIALVSGCEMPSSGKVTSLLTTSSQVQAPDSSGTYQTVPAGSAFSLSGAASASMSLGATSDQMYTLTTGAYSGSITITVEDDEVQAVDPSNQVSFTVTPSVIAISPNSTYNFTVHAATTTLAPDLDLHYHVVARDSSGSIRKETEMQTLFAIVANYDITILPTNNPALNAMLWSTDIVDPTTGIGKKQPLSFAAHAGGMTLTFYNKDVTPHIIHGGAMKGGIAHQNTSTYIRATGTGAVNPAGKTYVNTYVATVTTTVANLTDSYYSHDAESGSKAGSVTFNVVPKTTTTGGDPTATFTKVNVVLQASCISCHSTANPQFGVNLSSYASVLNTLVPGSGATSSLYTQVLSNAMPIGGTPLTQTNKDLIKNWIDNGALNN